MSDDRWSPGKEDENVQRIVSDKDRKGRKIMLDGVSPIKKY